MMHPETAAISQEQQQRFHHHHTSSSSNDDDPATVVDADKRVFSLWRLVRETLVVAPRRKVRSASYCMSNTERPRSGKRRAKSCGHAADAPDHRSQHHCHRHHQDGSGCAATGTADAWRKSKMLQELEASTAGGRSSATPAAAVLRRCVQTSERETRAALLGGRNRLAAQRSCRNCRQLFFTRNVDARVAAAFCSLDCQSSSEFLTSVQHVVDERFDDEGAPETTFTPTRAA